MTNIIDRHRKVLSPYPRRRSFKASSPRKTRSPTENKRRLVCEFAVVWRDELVLWAHATSANRGSQIFHWDVSAQPSRLDWQNDVYYIPVTSTNINYALRRQPTSRPVDEVEWEDDDNTDTPLEPSPARRVRAPESQMNSIVSGIAKRHQNNTQLQNRIRQHVLEEQKKGAEG